MGQTIRVSLPGYNALTDTNVDHFALFADADNVLIKEQSRGTYHVPHNSSQTMSHNLGYIPFVIVFGESGSTRHMIYGQPTDTINAYIYIDTNSFYIVNNASTDLYGTFYVFYDTQTS